MAGGALSLHGHAQAMRVAGSASDALEVVLEADHHKNHPFRPFRECVDAYDPEASPERMSRSPAPRKAGDRLSVRARLWPSEGPGLLPLRYARGYRAALVFTDHADQSRLAHLQALMYGSSAEGASGGFVGHGLGMTKSVFERSRRRGPLQLSEPAYRAAVSTLVQQHGIEIGPHSVGDGPDKREQTAASLPEFKSIGGAPVWIDHQPMTNCEALCNEGASPGSRYYLVDQLKAHNFRYAWAGTDIKAPPDGLNMFEPGRLQARVPVLYSHSAVDPDLERPILLFSAVWQYHVLDRFLREFSDERIDRMEAERGLHIAHTYLDAMNNGPGHRGKSLMEAVGDEVRLKAPVATWLAGLGRRQHAGTLWVAGIVAVADHLTGMQSVKIDGQGREARVRATEEVQDASFLIPGAAVTPSVNGRALRPAQFRQEDDGTVLWLELKPGVDYRLTW